MISDIFFRLCQEWYGDWIGLRVWQSISRLQSLPTDKALIRTIFILDLLTDTSNLQIVNNKGEMKGSAITGPVGKEAAELWPVSDSTS